LQPRHLHQHFFKPGKQLQPILAPLPRGDVAVQLLAPVQERSAAVTQVTVLLIELFPGRVTPALLALRFD